MIAYTEKQLFFRDETKLPLCLAAYWDNNSNSFPCGIHDAKLKISLACFCTEWMCSAAVFKKNAVGLKKVS